ncbi:hypothetical protein MMC34_005026 [Xylographa carneopallida]|nr:hypothetical protein [Xylographa carneopallida]
MDASEAEHLWDSVGAAYETAYSANPTLLSTLSTAIALLPPHAHVLDAGCGTGVPVASTLAAAGMQVTGIDLSGEMVALAQRAVPAGDFTKVSMTAYAPPRVFDGVFVVFSHMQLPYAAFADVMRRFVAALAEGGVLVLVGVPSDNYVADEGMYDAGGYVQDFPAPFMGHLVKTTLFTVKGNEAFVRGLGLEIVSTVVKQFLPKGETVPEDQFFIVARKQGSKR